MKAAETLAGIMAKMGFAVRIIAGWALIINPPEINFLEFIGIDPTFAARLGVLG